MDRRRGLYFTSAQSTKAVAIDLVDRGDGEREAGAPESRLGMGAAPGPFNGPWALMGFLQDYVTPRLLVGPK